ncbi:hypothetical protein T12_10740 [Trichinella patagoniensis]|uniref:Uncharacterized protein n=1 Tax=Trichinella patagoniensis TaxID=990121 RepID=A0A0V0ZLD2_9BILA|nr:hypothetical protein T12_10740 [Trichinella patagoniensis]
MLKINKLGKSVKLKRVLLRELSFGKQNVSLCDHPVVYLAICSLVFSSSSWVSAGVGLVAFVQSKPIPVSSGIKYDYDVEAAVCYRISNAESTDGSQFTSNSNNQNNCGENYPNMMDYYTDFTADDI